MKGRMTHLINEHGDRQVVETRNADEEIQRLNESTNSTYYLDVDWSDHMTTNRIHHLLWQYFDHIP